MAEQWGEHLAAMERAVTARGARSDTERDAIRAYLPVMRKYAADVTAWEEALRLAKREHVTTPGGLCRACNAPAPCRALGLIEAGHP